jgi:hypothetical protein
MIGDEEWRLTPGLRAVNHNSGTRYTLQQLWRNQLTGAEEWRDIPVFDSQGGVVWGDMGVKSSW